jgi:hypothetical protein
MAPNPTKLGYLNFPFPGKKILNLLAVIPSQ